MHIFLIYKKGPLWCGWSCSWIAGHCKVTVSRRMRGVLVWSLCYIGEGNGTPLQYSWLTNPTDRGAWWAAVHGVTRSRTGLSDFTFTFHFHVLEKEMATHSNVLAWRIPGTGEPGGLLSLGLHRVRHNWSCLAAADYSYKIALCVEVPNPWKYVLSFFIHVAKLASKKWYANLYFP